MAKKRRKKSDKTKRKENHTQINGFLLALLAALGLGISGPVGKAIAASAVFLVGDAYQFSLVFIIAIGFYMMFQKKWPNFFSIRFLGLYLMSIALLSLIHIQFVVINNYTFIELVKQTFGSVQIAFSNFSEFLSSDGAGGGMLGASFSYSMLKLFDIEGSRLVIIAFIAVGFVFVTSINVFDLIKTIMGRVGSGVKNIKIDMPTRREAEEKVKEAEKKFEADDKIVISSLDEIREPKEEIKEEPERRVIEEETISGYRMPPLALLNKPKNISTNADRETIEKNSKKIIKVLRDFDIIGKVTMVHPGPTVTQYEVELKSGTKVSKVTNINREIALALAAKNVRIQAPIPGKNTIGIELPNEEAVTVTLREVFESLPVSKKDSKLLVALGKNIMGEPKYLELDNAPHLLVAGATGSGKSVCINTIILSILLRTRPDEVKLLLIDPKQVELNIYNGVPHLLREVVTQPREAALALKRVVTEMEERYRLFNKTKTKNIAGYNAYIQEYNKKNTDKLPKLPFLVVIVDELADLMLVASKEVEDSIIRITQLARAAGIHLIVATQRPSTDVVTGLIKANLPSRISFVTSSSIDSRTILDMTGAEKLLGKGDMLFLPMGESVPLRLQGAFVTDSEIKKVIDFVSKQQKAKYDELYTELEQTEKTHNTQEEQYEDPLYESVVEFIVTSGKASASLIQRRFKVGYNRAARLIDQLEERGIVGPPNGSKPREVLVKLGEK